MLPTSTGSNDNNYKGVASMDIYLTQNLNANSFNRVAPYVYALEWQDGSIYIGARSANTKKPKSDLFNHYFTSSKYVHERLDANNYPTELIIFDTFDCQKHAHDTEQEILESIRELGLWNRVLNRNIRGHFYERVKTKEELKATEKAWNESEAGKASKKRWRESSKGKNYRRSLKNRVYMENYNRTQECKNVKKEWRQSPEGRDYTRNYDRAYRQTPKRVAYMKAYRLKMKNK